MRLENSVTLGLPVEDAWKVLTDGERIAPCIPGAELQEVAGDEYRGIFRVKVGAITAQYRGAVRLREVDEAGRRIVLEAEGSETDDPRHASATVRATLADAGEGRTRVAIETDLAISGRIAQYGRGVLADVSSALLADFAGCLEREVVAVGAAASATGAGVTDSEIVADEIADVAVEDPERAAKLVSVVSQGPTRPAGSRPPEPVDVLAVAGGSVAERAVPAAIVGVLLLQVVPKGRLKRLGLAVLGSALVAGLVAGKQQQEH